MEDVPDDPELDYHTFRGWFTSAACGAASAFDPSQDRPSDDMTLYAGWTATPFDIQYDLAGGVNAAGNPATYTVDDADIHLAAPTRTGYSFDGWTGGGADEADG